MKRIIHAWTITTFLLVGTISCGVKEQIGRLSSKQAGLILEKGVEIVKNLEAQSGEKYEEEYERIYISDTNFIELRYGSMDLPESTLLDKEDDDYYVELQIEKIISDKETASKIAVAVLEPYYRESKENLALDVQYIPSYGYYYIMLREYGKMEGHRIEFILDERDGRVLKLWDRDNKWAFFRN